MNCSKLCLFCQNPQKFKVNFPKIHGVCEQLHSNPSSIVKCTFCSSIVPIINFQEIHSTSIQSKANEDSNISLPIDNKPMLQNIPFISPSVINHKELSLSLQSITIVPRSLTFTHSSPNTSVPSAPIGSDHPIQPDPQPPATLIIKDLPDLNIKTNYLKHFLMITVAAVCLLAIAMPKAFSYFTKFIKST